MHDWTTVLLVLAPFIWLHGALKGRRSGNVAGFSRGYLTGWAVGRRSERQETQEGAR